MKPFDAFEAVADIPIMAVYWLGICTAIMFRLLFCIWPELDGGMFVWLTAAGICIKVWGPLPLAPEVYWASYSPVNLLDALLIMFGVPVCMKPLPPDDVFCPFPIRLS